MDERGAVERVNSRKGTKEGMGRNGREVFGQERAEKRRRELKRDGRTRILIE